MTKRTIALALDCDGSIGSILLYRSCLSSSGAKNYGQKNVIKAYERLISWLKAYVIVDDVDQVIIYNASNRQSPLIDYENYTRRNSFKIHWLAAIKEIPTILSRHFPGVFFKLASSITCSQEDVCSTNKYSILVQSLNRFFCNYVTPSSSRVSYYFFDDKREILNMTRELIEPVLRNTNINANVCFIRYSLIDQIGYIKSNSSNHQSYSNIEVTFSYRLVAVERKKQGKHPLKSSDLETKSVSVGINTSSHKHKEKMKKTRSSVNQNKRKSNSNSLRSTALFPAASKENNDHYSEIRKHHYQSLEPSRPIRHRSSRRSSSPGCCPCTIS